MEETTFKIVPLLRGFTEIETLFNAVTERNGIICGGYARYCASTNKKPEAASDIDVFPYNEDAFKKLEGFFREEGFEERHQNDISLTYKRNESPKWFSCPTVQIIKPVKEGAVVSVGDMKTILENFDFTVVRAGILNSKEVMVDIDFEEDERKKMLRFKNIHCPISSTFRVIKYTKRGYWITTREVLGLFLDWENRDDEYRERIVELFKKADESNNDMSGKLTDNGSDDFDREKQGLSEEEIQELESLLRID
jgi:hypothetical protein